MHGCFVLCVELEREEARWLLMMQVSHPLVDVVVILAVSQCVGQVSHPLVDVAMILAISQCVSPAPEH